MGAALTAAAITAMMANPLCTWPGMAPEFWPAVMATESPFHPYALHDDTAGLSFYPETARAAEDLTRALWRDGHSVGLGLSQLTARSAEEFEAKFSIKPAQAFDPCTNMRTGARFYVERALTIYNCGRADCGTGYAARVQRHLVTISTAPTPPSPGPPPHPAADPHAPPRDALHGGDPVGLVDLLHPAKTTLLPPKENP